MKRASKGPRFPDGPPKELEEGSHYDPRTPDVTAIHRIANYRRDFVMKVMRDSEKTFEGLSQTTYFSQTGHGDSEEEESSSQQNWGGLDEEVDEREELQQKPHTDSYALTKHDYHEFCNIIDGIYQQDPANAKEQLAKYKNVLNKLRDESRAILRDKNTTEKSTTREPMIHNIMADEGNNRASVRRTFHSLSAHPAKRHRINVAEGKSNSADQPGTLLQLLDESQWDVI